VSRRNSGNERIAGSANGNAAAAGSSSGGGRSATLERWVTRPSVPRRDGTVR
jgi:hypothetical protein